MTPLSVWYFQQRTITLFDAVKAIESVTKYPIASYGLASTIVLQTEMVCRSRPLTARRQTRRVLNLSGQISYSFSSASGAADFEAL
jgi:hypothetical protein